MEPSAGMIVFQLVATVIVILLMVLFIRWLYGVLPELAKYSLDEVDKPGKWYAKIAWWTLGMAAILLHGIMVIVAWFASGVIALIAIKEARDFWNDK